MKKKVNSYKRSGVNIALGNKFVKHISNLTKKSVQKEHKSPFSNDIGGFGSIYDLKKTKIKDPILVSCTDGVGTKLDLSIKFKKINTIGIDLVAMCVNDLIVLGAKPLFFLDYIAVEKLDLKKVKKIFKGILKGCEISKCSLLGGETAEMPGIYIKNKFDLAGFSVGVVSRQKILNKNNVRDGDLILAIPSNGIHSNGYSLVRKLLVGKTVTAKMKNEIIKPTKIYSNEILKASERKLISAAANITGGGITENIVRSIPDNYTANIDLSKIRILNVFKWIKKNDISDEEMLKTFNCGVGFCVIIKKKNLQNIKKIFKKHFAPYIIGYISKGNRKLRYENKLRW